MKLPPFVIYIEQKPQEYIGPIGITIRCRPDEVPKAEYMRAIIEKALSRYGGKG